MSAVIDETIEDLTTVRAVLNYTRNTGVRPVNYTFEPPPGVPRNSGEIDARTVTSPSNAPPRRSIEIRAMVFW